jgi:7-cyano-7-deazaguanine synthase in queuosine biosynthesis
MNYLEQIKNNPNENLKIIKMINKFSKENEKFPQKGEKVALLLSGGLDSIAVWYLLMKKHQLEVFPIVINKKTIFKSELRSINYYSKKFEKIFEKLHHRPFFIDDPRKSQIKINKKYLSKRNFKKNKDEFIIDFISDEKNVNEIFAQTTNFIIHAQNYLNYLEAQKGIKINTIFTGNLTRDGETIKHQSITSLKITELLISHLSNNEKFQVYPYFIYKKNIGKKGIIKFLKKEGLNLEKSWSCYRDLPVPCGSCSSCRARRWYFQEAKIKENRFYLTDINTKKEEIIRKGKNGIKKILYKK